MFQSYEQIIENMEEELQEIQKVKWKIILRYIIGWGMLFLSIFIFGILAIEMKGFIQMIAALALFIGVVASIVFLIRTYGRFRFDFKDIIVREMVKQLIE